MLYLWVSLWTECLILSRIFKLISPQYFKVSVDQSSTGILDVVTFCAWYGNMALQLFLTLSCAEYESLEISTYLRKVNDVPDIYPIGKVCTEDPILVSRRFSQKFHDFFQTVILKGDVWAMLLTTSTRRSYRHEEHQTTTYYSGYKVLQL